jgi:phytoene dehydrogenase-like protein
MAALHKKSAGWPLGGSLEFARRMERRFCELGGRIRYGARVETILVEGKRAGGVVLADGTRIAADAVIAAADGWTTVMRMLDGRFLDRKTARSYRHEAICPSALQLSFGVRMDLSAMPHNRCFHLGRKLVLAGTETDSLTVRHYGYDPAMAPAGCTALVCHLNGDYAWWARLDRKAYEAAKNEVVEQVLSLLEERIPGFRQAVEAADVATPLSFARYTGNREGSIMGWATEIGSMTRQRRRTLPGLRGFYMAGQWVESGGGLPPAVLSGRQVAELICRQDGRPFTVGMQPGPAAS